LHQGVIGYLVKITVSFQDINIASLFQNYPTKQINLLTESWSFWIKAQTNKTGLFEERVVINDRCTNFFNQN